MRGYTVPTAFIAIDRYSAPVRKMAGATSAFVNSSRVGLAHTERAFRKLISPLTAINRLLMGMGYYVGLFTFVAILRGAIGVISDFQKAQVDIAAVSGTTVQKNKALSAQARQLAVDYGLAAESISRVQYELVKAGQAPGGNMKNVLAMTPAITLGAKAMDVANPDAVTKMLVADMKAFNLGPEKAMDMINSYAKAIDISMLDFESLESMLRNARQAQAFVGQGMDSFQQMLIQAAIVRDAAIHVASGGTALKNFNIKNITKGMDTEEAFRRLLASPDLLGGIIKQYGPKTFQGVAPLARAIGSGNDKRYMAEFKRGLDTYAQHLANMRAQTIAVGWDKLKSSYQELILSIDDGTGSLTKAIQHYLQVGSAVLLLAADSDIAKNALSKMSPEVVNTAERYLFWLKVLKWLAIALVVVKIAMLAWKAAVAITTAVVGLWNIAHGVMAFFLGWNKRLIAGNILAMNAYRVSAWLATTATRAWTAALWANPITWIIALIVGLIVLIYNVVDSWNQWGAAVSQFMGPVGMLISGIMSIRKNWDYLVRAFTTDGIMAGLKALRNVLFDVFMTPMQQVYLLLAKLPGKIGETSSRIASLIEMSRLEMGLSANTDTDGNPIPIPIVSTKGANDGGNVKVSFENKPDSVKVSGDKKYIGNIMPELRTTFGQYFPFK